MIRYEHLMTQPIVFKALVGLTILGKDRDRRGERGSNYRPIM